MKVSGLAASETVDANYHCSFCKQYKADPEDHLHGNCKNKWSGRWAPATLFKNRRTRWNDVCRKFVPMDTDEG
jgi:hypothetical protein